MLQTRVPISFAVLKDAVCSVLDISPHPVQDLQEALQCLPALIKDAFLPRSVSGTLSEPQVLASSALTGLSPKFFVFFFPFIFISWRLITLQYCSGFCHTLT